MDARELANEIGEQEGHGIVLLDPPEIYDKAIIGFTENGSATVAVYSWAKLIDALADDLKDGEYTKDDPRMAAIEWLEYNTLRSLPYMGEYAPIIIHEMEEYE